MSRCNIVYLFLLVIFYHVTFLNGDEKLEKLLLQIPGYLVTEKDEYACHTMKLPNGKIFVKRVEPIVDENAVHHLGVFVSKEPLIPRPVESGSICQNSTPRGIYLWTRHVIPLELPEDTAFEMGEGTDAIHIILQIHYGKPRNEKDYSGVAIYWTPNPTKYDAGVLFLGNRNKHFIPPNQSNFKFFLSCQLNFLTATLYPFAFRTHTHDLGRSVLGYYFSSDKTKMIEVGQANPQWPQRFYPIKPKFAINKGDYLAARCVFDTRNRTTNIKFGDRSEDEMCYFFIIYSIERSGIKEKPYDQFHCDDNDFPDLFSELPNNISDYMPDQIPKDFFASKFHHL